MAKFYAVKEGRKKGIFYTWDECKAQTQGFSGAVYKSFQTLSLAEEYLNPIKTEQLSLFTREEEIYGCVAYVDGSYDINTHNFSYGVIILKDGLEHEFYKSFCDPALADMRNVSGEIKGAEFAMQYCIENNIPAIKIYYDYEGVSKWCLGDWKTNKDGTKAYKAYYDSIKDRLSVEFIKVKSHSGDKYNDIADYLAKKALGIV